MRKVEPLLHDLRCECNMWTRDRDHSTGRFHVLYRGFCFAGMLARLYKRCARA